MATLMRHRLAGGPALCPILPEMSATRFKQFAAETRHQPAVVVIGDDGDEPQGPSGWPLAVRAVRWAAAIMLHGAAAEVEQYETVVAAARIVQRVLVIETCSALLSDWATLVRAAPHRPSVLVIVPKEGQHPAPIDRSAMQ